MKTEQEVREEIKATQRTKENVRKAYNEGKITKQSYKYQIVDLNATLETLYWVLGENDRFD